MAFQRILLGALAVLALFVAWWGAARRLRREPESPAAGFRAAIVPLVAEAVLLALFAGLWFGSLGSGGAPLLFLVLGSLLEIPDWLRDRRAGAGVLPVAARIGRVVLAGMVLQLLLT